MTVTIRNTNELYGDATEFHGDTLEEAVDDMQECLRCSGPAFAEVVVTEDDYEVMWTVFEVCDNSGEKVLDATNWDDAIAEAKADTREVYDRDTATYWVDFKVGPVGGEPEDYREFTLAIEPEEPECVHEDGHDWQAPYWLLGGLKENPGVWGKGGGTIRHECCMRCGCRKTVDNWAQRRDTGEQGLCSTEYEEGCYSQQLEEREEAEENE